MRENLCEEEQGFISSTDDETFEIHFEREPNFSDFSSSVSSTVPRLAPGYQDGCLQPLVREGDRRGCPHSHPLLVTPHWERLKAADQVTGPHSSWGRTSRTRLPKPMVTVNISQSWFQRQGSFLQRLAVFILSWLGDISVQTAFPLRVPSLSTQRGSLCSVVSHVWESRLVILLGLPSRGDIERHRVWGLKDGS